VTIEKLKLKEWSRFKHLSHNRKRHVMYVMTTSSSYYRAMHFSAKRGIAIACRLSVRLSVCL